MLTNIKRSALALMTALAAVAVFAVPAAAEVTPATVVFSGSATVSGGLHFPGVGGPKANGTWSFTSGPNSQTPASVPGDCQVIGPFSSLPDLANGNCAIAANGDLGAVASPANLPLGAWCGFSAGWSGSGTATATKGLLAGIINPPKSSNDVVLNLSKVGWFASAGSILPIHGRWDVDSPVEKDDSKGTLVGVVQAFGGDTCASTGAGNFGVIGVVSLV